LSRRAGGGATSTSTRAGTGADAGRSSARSRRGAVVGGMASPDDEDRDADDEATRAHSRSILIDRLAYAELVEVFPLVGSVRLGDRRGQRMQLRRHAVLDVP